jgi:protocatechuate 3,4-dioxygenase beta subunit
MAACAIAAMRAAPSPKPTPALPPSTSTVAAPAIEGVVKGPQGKPFDGALVIAWPSVDSDTDPPLIARTDAAGRFRIAVRRRGPHTVRVEAPGLAAQSLEKVEPGAPLSFALSASGTIEGRVRDAATGAAVPGARVEAWEAKSKARPTSWDAGTGRIRTRSDAQGRFRLEGLARGLHTISASARGFGNAQKERVAPGAQVDLYLFAGGTLAGTVRDGRGQPVAEVQVRLDGDPDSVRFAHSAPTVSIETSDAQGRFEFVGLEAGSYRASAHHKDYAPAWTPAVAVEKGSQAVADLTLLPGAAVSGRLVGAREKPVAGRVVVQDADGQAVPRAIDELLRGEAGADGRFRLAGFPSGSYVLRAQAPGYAPQRVDVTVSRAQAALDLGDVALETGLTIRGRVQDKGGLPVADALVHAGSPPLGFSLPVEGRTEPDGSFVLAGLERGVYRVVASASGYGRAQREAVRAGSDHVDFVLQPAGAVTGMVTDEAGRAVESFSVAARPAIRDMGTTTGSRAEVFSDPTGRFVLDELAAAEYIVEVTAPERASGIVSSVKVASGGATDVGQIVLGAGGIVRGMVVDAAGAPVAGAAVVASSPGMAGTPLDSGPPTATSDAGGLFELRGVTPGSTQVVARHPGYADGVLGVTVDPAKGPAEVRLVLAQGGRIEGRVHQRDGGPVAGAMVLVIPNRGGARILLDVTGMRPVGPDGSFVVEHVWPGRAEILLFLRTAAGGLQNTQHQSVEVKEAETATVDLVASDMLVTGRVLRAGAPAAGIRLTLRGAGALPMLLPNGSLPADPQEPRRLTATSGEDGSYQLLVDRPGRYTIEAASADGQTSFAQRTAEIPDVDVHVLDVNIGGVTLSGVVIDRKTERPIPGAMVSASPTFRETLKARQDPDTGSGTTAADGRFQLELAPGEYTLSGRADGYSSETLEVAAADAGGTDVLLALTPGLVIVGRVVDELGRGVDGILVIASPRDPQLGSRGGAMTEADGSFRVSGLEQGRFALSARSSVGTYALCPDAAPGDKPVLLVLRRGGRVALEVHGPDGAAVGGAHATLTTVDGFSAIGAKSSSPESNAEGLLEMDVPAGTVEIFVTTPEMTGTTEVKVPAGATIAAAVTLTPH